MRGRFLTSVFASVIHPTTSECGEPEINERCGSGSTRNVLIKPPNRIWQVAVPISKDLSLCPNLARAKLWSPYLPAWNSFRWSAITTKMFFSIMVLVVLARVAPKLFTSNDWMWEPFQSTRTAKGLLQHSTTRTKSCTVYFSFLWGKVSTPEISMVAIAPHFFENNSIYTFVNYLTASGISCFISASNLIYNANSTLE